MVHNLAEDPEYAGLVEEHRKRLKQEMESVLDSAYIPESMFPALAGDRTLADFLGSGSYQERLPRLKLVAEAAASRDLRKVPILINALKSDDPLLRYWGARGCLIRWEKVGVAQKFLERVLDDENAAVRVTAAHALGKLGRTELALGVLGKEIQSDNDYEVLIALHALEDFPQDWKRFDARLREIAKKGKRGNASRVAAWMLKQMK